MASDTGFNGAELGDLHPCDEPGGWPEFSITLDFYVRSDDPHVQTRERQRVFQRIGDLILEDPDVG